MEASASSLGTGTYVLVGEVAGQAGNALWISFLMAAGMATVVGLGYAELASAFPRAGAKAPLAAVTSEVLGDRASDVSVDDRPV